MSLLPIDEPPPESAPGGFALSAFLALGFRPLYLLAASFAALALPLWVAAWLGAVALPLPGVFWHAHEMLFGFAAAVIVGFLYTAGRNWTGLPTPSGGLLAALCLIWLAGRLALLASAAAWAAVVDMAFLPVAALLLARVLVRARSRRNYFTVVLLLALAAANLAFHLARLGLLATEPLRPLWFALGLVTLLETTIGGRVIPMFTGAALRGVRPLQNHRLNQAAIALTGLALLAWVGSLGAVAALLAAAAAAAQTVRCLGWKPWATRGEPLLWSLHAAHAWIPLGLVLIALAELGLVPRSAAVHALAIGATGGLILAMITRTARGHLGRPLRAERLETTAYAAVQGAVLLRVGTLLLAPAYAAAGVLVAAGLWVVAFALYVGRYAPWLLRPRPDGRPG